MNAPQPYFLEHIWLIPMFPLLTAALMLFYGRRLQKKIIDALCVGSVGLSFLYSAGAFFQLIAKPEDERLATRILFEWIPAGPYHLLDGRMSHFVADWGFQIDALSAVMILVVTGVGLLIHIYSTGYMAHEGGYYRFFGYLNLFMFAMLILVLANNLVLLFVGWEGVGTCSYLLIGFYFHRKSASDAGKKAFIVNRVGDAGFLLGIFLTSALLGTVRFTELGPALAAGHFKMGDPLITAIALLFFVGATGKSAQIPLYVWLPDAMEGPTPVSALIHAATMVTAGVYMVTRTNAIYQLAPKAMAVVALVGAVTALFAASIGVVQNDIKKVLAYSTVSQLGYMFLACGVGAFSAGIFHLMTHAFFKGLLFLAAGSVIHALSGEQDMRKMGALSKKIPVDILDDADRRAGHRRNFSVCGIFEQGPDSGQDLRKGRFSLGHRILHGGHDGVLHVPADIHDVSWDVARGARSGTPHSRIAEIHAGAAGDSRGAFDCGRLVKLAGNSGRA